MINDKDIAIRDERAGADYWIECLSNGDEIWLAHKDILKLNREMAKRCNTLAELMEFPGALKKEELAEMILFAKQDFRSDDETGKYYDWDGTPVDRDALKAAHDNCSLPELKRRNPARYAVTVDRADIRLLPACRNFYDTPDFLHYDLMQGTALDPSEPVIALHESTDGRFVFIQARNYTGWVARSVLAYADKEVWEKYVNPKDFLVVVENKEYIKLDGEKKILFQMGSRILLRPGECEKDGRWRALFPISDNGRLREVEVLLPKSDSFHRGWLPCTPGNWINQAFRFLGEPYGWGGMEESVDCSAFVGDVCRSMGIEIPRDADEQEIAMPDRIELSGLSKSERYKTLSRVPAGSLIFKPGHVLMYLGQDDSGTPLVIHAISSYYTFNGAVREKHYIREVLVSGLDFKGYSGREAIEDATSIGCFKRIDI